MPGTTQRVTVLEFLAAVKKILRVIFISTVDLTLSHRSGLICCARGIIGDFRTDATRKVIDENKEQDMLRARDSHDNCSNKNV